MFDEFSSSNSFSEEESESPPSSLVIPLPPEDESLQEPTKSFKSFEHCYHVLLTEFSAFGLKCRIRDTHWEGLHQEENVVRRKYQCAEPACSWFAWFVRKPSGIVELNKKFNFVHSHPCTPLLSVPTPRLPFTQEEIKVMKLCRDSGITPAKIKAFMDLSFPKVYDESRIRNYLFRGRRWEIRHDIKNFIDTLTSLSQEDELKYSLDVDEDGTLDKVFVMFKDGEQSYRNLGRAVGIDATYDTNRYSFALVTFVGKDYSGRIHSFCYGLITDETTASYLWLFKEFVRHIGNVLPEIVISDGDGAIAAAVSMAFPSSLHRLCWWHLRKNIAKNLRKKGKRVDQCFFAKMINISRLGKQEHAKEKFHSLLEEYKIQDVPYARNLVHLMPKWCDAFLPRVFIGNYRTTQMNESQHSRLKRELTSASTLGDCLRVIQKVKKREMHLSGIPRMRLSLHVLSALNKTLTAVATRMLEQEVQDAHQVECVRECGGKHVVTELGGDYEVALMESSGKRYNCDCGFFTRSGLPCRHMIATFMKMGQMELVHLHIMRCWHTCSICIGHEKEKGSTNPIEHTVGACVPCEQDMQLESVHANVFSDATAMLKRLFAFEHEEGFDECLDVVIKTLKGEIETMKHARFEAEEASVHDGACGQKERELIVKIPRDLSGIGHPRKRRKRSSEEVRKH
eukprot:TRINITY_DN512_c0_g1_i1.p1 TRINITY_DN512_c0_g1~~TRINITY_DN512_c0_g1_i1.p1  ORF type:complete len:681 (+),score=131.74 TRINITY_DN512_c0_g1_i1:4450-6492(+)